MTTTTTAAPTTTVPSRHWLATLVTCTLFLIVCLSWGTTWLGIKIAVESVPPLTAAGLRFLIAFPLFACFAWLRREPLMFQGAAGASWCSSPCATSACPIPCSTTARCTFPQA